MELPKIKVGYLFKLTIVSYEPESLILLQDEIFYGIRDTETEGLSFFAPF